MAIGALAPRGPQWVPQESQESQEPPIDGEQCLKSLLPIVVDSGTYLSLFVGSGVPLYLFVGPSPA